MNRKISSLANMINECNNIVFFGGAGVSTESGVRDYRSKNGLYETVKEYGVPPEKILSRSFFDQSPEIFYDFYRKYFMIDTEPNPTHKALSELEKRGKLKAVVTQNIDGLHQKAGSKTVIELHGTSSLFICSPCKSVHPSEKFTEMIKNGDIPKCPDCGAVMRPKVVLYEEPLYPGVGDSAIDYISNADMLIVGGTSLAVYPAASFLEFFGGKYVVVINKSETTLDMKADLVINDSIGKVFADVMKEL